MSAPGIDPKDIVRRIRTVLPDRWFADASPVLDGLLAGFGAGWAGLFALLERVRQQSRVRTATGEFLDLAGLDFFGRRLLRRAGEDDATYRARLLRALRRERATRAAVIAEAAEQGRTIVVFEPAQPGDTGVYGGPRLGYGVAGAWGSLQMPFEALATVSGVRDAAVMAALDEALPAGGALWVKFSG